MLAQQIYIKHLITLSFVRVLIELTVCIFSELLYDKKQNIPYSTTLSKVDVSCGAYGMYNFYKMQVRDSNVCRIAIYYYSVLLVFMTVLEVFLVP